MSLQAFCHCSYVLGCSSTNGVHVLHCVGDFVPKKLMPRKTQAYISCSTGSKAGQASMRQETYLEDLHLGIRARHIEQRHGAQLLIWVPDACAVPSPHHCTLHNTTIYVVLAPPKTFTQSVTDLLYPSEHQRNYIQALEPLAMRPFLKEPVLSFILLCLQLRSRMMLPRNSHSQPKIYF